MYLGFDPRPEYGSENGSVITSDVNIFCDWYEGGSKLTPTFIFCE